MPILTTEQAIEHCRADPEADATMVALYLGAATDVAQEYIKRKLFADQAELDAAVAAETAGESPLVATYAVKAAILLICGHLFANREDVVTGAQSFALPMGAHDLLRPYRLSFGL